MRDTEVFAVGDVAGFTAALKNNGKKQARKPASTPKTQNTTTTTATLSGAHSEPGEGDRHGALMRLSALRYYVRWRATIGFDFWTPYSDRTTAPHARYADAVTCAERELRER